MANVGFELLPCADSDERAAACRRALEISRPRAIELGKSAVEAAELGYYLDKQGARVDWSSPVQQAVAHKLSIPPGDPLPAGKPIRHASTRLQVCNETTFQAAARLTAAGARPLALNFANGVHPGGGFLNGARAQEEVLCRSSALYSTLVGDPMYAAHRNRPQSDSSDWVIYSPGVPVFRTDDGTPLDAPWQLGFLTSAAPYAPHIGQPASGDLLQSRIHRVLDVAAALGYETLVLGAWGCGAFGNDPKRTAIDFRSALQQEFNGCFSEIVFAVADWSPGRRYLGPFRDVFRPGG